jgi:hypothetical protein
VSITELSPAVHQVPSLDERLSSDSLVIHCKLPVFSPIDTGLWCRVTRASHHHDSMEFFAGRVRYDQIPFYSLDARTLPIERRVANVREE